MSDPELTNINKNNEISSDDSVTNDEDYAQKSQSIKILDKNIKDNPNEMNLNVKEVNSENIVLETGKIISAPKDSISDKDELLHGFNNNAPSDVKMEDKSLPTRQYKENSQVLKIPNKVISSAKGDIANGGNISGCPNLNVSENASNGDCLSSFYNQTMNNSIEAINVAAKVNGDMKINFNIVPNPNEFNLVGKNNSLLQNPKIVNANQLPNELLADSSIVISNSNAIPQSDSIVSSNYSLSQLQQYMSDDEEDSVIEELPVVSVSQQYREAGQLQESDDNSDSSTSSSTSILISDSSSDSESEDEYENFNVKPECKPIKAKGELDLCDLPPIEDLTITVPEEECIPIGKIYQIVDLLVIVQANKDTPAYDLDTVLFTQGGKPLGKVFDVMGPVTEPYYCIRFNSKAHIKEKNITLDQIVYAAPKTPYSKFVFLAQLMQLKGSDASWENDVEPPEIYLDYSDDEQEQRAKKKLHRNKKASQKADSDPDEPARKRHSAYVKKMNARNLRLTAARSNSNPNRNRSDNNNIVRQKLLPMDVSPISPSAAAPYHQMFGKPPHFDMRVPPQNPPHGGPHFHRHEFSVFPQRFSNLSATVRAPGPPLSQNFFPSGPMPFSRPCTSQAPMGFPRHCPSSPGPMPFPGAIASSPGPVPYPRACPSSPGPTPFSRHSAPSGPVPYSRPCSSQGHQQFPRPGASSGPPGFAMSCVPPGPRPPAFSSPVPYGQLPSNHGHGWRSISRPDTEWPSPYHSGPVRNAPPPHPFSSSPFSGDFPGPFPVRGSPQTAPGVPWPTQPNSRGNNFNPSAPPPSPNVFQN